MKRTSVVVIRTSPEERARLARVAKRHALSVAGVVRMLVKKEDDANKFTDKFGKPKGRS